MSADVLREAARLMRERAEAATPGPWECDERSGVDDFHFGHIPTPVIQPMGYYGPRLNDARHIASWHPAVALAVADWLDAAVGATTYQFDNALAVARAYRAPSRPAAAETAERAGRGTT